MIDVPHSIFNARAAEKLHSPDGLDKYVRVTSPSKWTVVAALALHARIGESKRPKKRRPHEKDD